MKKVIFLITVILLFGITATGQSLEKGNLVGTHVVTVDLKPGVTTEQWQTFILEKYIPELEKYYEGFKIFLVKGIRGPNINSYGFLWVIKSEKHRDKYFQADGEYNEQGLMILEKLNPIMDELEKLGTFTYEYTDWIVL
ncbi:MAG: hypothetical protein AMS27_14355 [Bacteroides sp. SM23_62_1]|nr:MAG: hypothetical protein AMS27_14355 [Bacteroides sp. SM23_62_1]